MLTVVKDKRNLKNFCFLYSISLYFFQTLWTSSTSMNFVNPLELIKPPEVIIPPWTSSTFQKHLQLTATCFKSQSIPEITTMAWRHLWTDLYDQFREWMWKPFLIFVSSWNSGADKKKKQNFPLNFVHRNLIATHLNKNHSNGLLMSWRGAVKK